MQNLQKIYRGKYRWFIWFVPIALCFLLTLSLPIGSKIYWSAILSIAEAKWKTSRINDYKLTGKASWGWHEHSFTIAVVGGQIASSECNLVYDTTYGADWCAKQFDASAYLVPALFDKAGELLEFNRDISPIENCFGATFDISNGAPTKIWIDCSSADDEQEEWLISFTPNVP